MYDYIIIGAGPTGLTLAHILSQYDNKILIIEKENYIGGCHGVARENGLFAEHGPRIYISNYYTFKQILKEINLFHC
jgi:UDP-galactopyranose mutase